VDLLHNFHIHTLNAVDFTGKLSCKYHYSRPLYWLVLWQRIQDSGWDLRGIHNKKYNFPLRCRLNVSYCMLCYSKQNYERRAPEVCSP